MEHTMDAGEVGAWLDQHDIEWVKTEGISPDGLIIGKHLHRSKFEKALPLGNAITELVMGYDLGGTPYLAWWDEWRRDALGDFHQRPDLATLVVAPDRPRTANVLCDTVDLAGNSLPVCPRTLLKRLVNDLSNQGFVVKAAFEIEAMIFANDYRNARESHYRNLTPLSHPVPIGYLHLNSRQQLTYIDEVIARLNAIGIPVETWHDEAGPGQLEINLDPCDPVTACDRVVRAKQVMREVAMDQAHIVTFMAKPNAEYGNGLHVHHSLVRDNEPVFYAPDGVGMSQTCQHWLGGLMATLPGATSLLCPTINSFRRMIGFSAAPTVASWGEDNKSTALRVLSRSPNAARIENRVAGGDANPYLVLAAELAGGLAGLKLQIEAPPEMTVTGWGLPEGWPHLPNTITKAADALAADSLLGDVLGADFVSYWINTRRWEWLMFNTTGGDAQSTTVTQWELDRYFELV